MVRFRVVLIALSILAPALLLAPAGADSATAASQLPATVRHAGLAWTGTHAYLFGGYDGDGNETTAIVRFDPTDASSTTLTTQLPRARALASTIWDPTVKRGCPTGCAYLFGGDGPDDNLELLSDDVLRYDPVSGATTLLAPLPQGRAGAAAIFDPRDRPEAGCDDGCVYIFGGSAAGGCCVAAPSADILKYNPATDITMLMPAALPRTMSRPAVLFDGTHAYLFSDGSVVRFDPLTNSVTSLPASFPRTGAVAVWTGTHGYVFGGAGTGPQDAIVRFHPASGALVTKAASLPTPQSSAVAFWDGAAAWVLGGRDPASGQDLASIVRYTLEPGAAGSLSAFQGNAPDVIRLTWTAPAANSHDSPILGYKVYRGEASGELVEVADLGPSLSWNDTGRTQGVRYHYAVRAHDANGPGAPSVETSFALPIPASPPRDLNVTSTARDRVTLTWSPPEDDGGAPVVSYVVSVGESPEALVDLTGGHFSPYTHAGLQAGKTYHFSVRAYTSAGHGANATASGAPLATPLPPTGIGATAGPGAGEISVTWTPPTLEPTVPAVTSFRVYRCTSSAPASCVFATEVPGTTATDTGLPKNTLRYYFVRSVNDAGESAWGGWGSARTFDVPSVVGSLSANLADDTSIALSWTAPSTTGGMPLTGYRVLRSTAFGPYVAHDTTTATSYVDAGLQPGTRYAYRVAAMNEVGDSATPAWVSVTTPSAPGAPTNVLAGLTSSLGEVHLTWSAPATTGGRPVVGYTVHRGTAPGAYDTSIDVGLALSHLDTGLPDGVRHHYAVTARNQVGEGTLSPEVSIVTWAAIPPAAPVGLVAKSGPSYGGVRLTWAAPPANGGLPATGYVVHRAEAEGPFSPLATVAGTAFDDTGLQEGAVYRYQVTGVNVVGEGAGSAVASAAARVPVLPAALAGAAVASVDGKAYVIGGENASGALDTILVHDPATGSATVVRAVLPSPRSGAAAVAVDDKIWLFGGKNGPNATSEILVFDPATLAVAVHPTALPLSARHEIAATYADGQVWLYGGRTPAGATVCGHVRLDPATGVATPRSGFPCIYGATALPEGPMNVIAGGCYVDFSDCGRAVVRMDRATGNGEARSNTLRTAHVHGAVVWDGTSLVVIGGTAGSTTSNTIEVVSGWGSKTLSHTLPTPRARSAAFWDGSRTLLFGGTGCAATWCPLGPLVLSIAPGAPQALAAAPTGNGRVLLDWLAPPSSTYTALVAYELTRVDPDGTRVHVATLPPSGLSFTDATAPTGLLRYELVARGAGGHTSAATTATTAALRVSGP